MGNTQVFRHRFPALTVALLSTVALFLSIGSASTCNFVKVSTGKRTHLDKYYGTDGLNYYNDQLSKIPGLFDFGLFCALPYSSNSDQIRDIAQAFIIIALFLVSAAAILSWGISIFIHPSSLTWKLISILASLTALLQIPAFLLVESKPCQEFECKISSGAYMLICSTACLISVTALTQFWEVPQWAQLLDTWKVSEQRLVIASGDGNNGAFDDDYYPTITGFGILRAKSPRSLNLFSSRIFGYVWYDRLKSTRRVAITEQSIEDYDERHSSDDRVSHGQPKASYHDFNPDASYYAASDNSRLMLHVTSNGRKLGDEDRQSEWSFANSLEEDIRLAEMEKGIESKNKTHSFSQHSQRSHDHDNKSISSRGSLSSSYKSPSVKPIQFTPAVVAAQGTVSNESPAHCTDTKPSDDTASDLTSHDPKQSLLDKNIRIEGADGKNWVSVLADSPRLIGSVLESSLRLFSGLVHGNKTPAHPLNVQALEQDKCSSSQVVLSQSLEQKAEAVSESFAELSTIPDINIVDDTNDINTTVDVMSTGSRSDCEPIASWEIFQDNTAFYNAITAGTNAALMSNEIEEKLETEMVQMDDMKSVSSHTLSSHLGDSDIGSCSESESDLNIIIGVQELRKDRHRNESLKKKRKKKSKNRSTTSSVCSKLSLLDLTIDEETVDDLQHEEISDDDASALRSRRSGIRFKRSSKSPAEKFHEQGYLSRHISQEDSLTAGLKLVATVLSKVKETPTKTSYESIVDSMSLNQTEGEYSKRERSQSLYRVVTPTDKSEKQNECTSRVTSSPTQSNRKARRARSHSVGGNRGRDSNVLHISDENRITRRSRSYASNRMDVKAVIWSPNSDDNVDSIKETIYSGKDERSLSSRNRQVHVSKFATDSVDSDNSDDMDYLSSKGSVIRQVRRRRLSRNLRDMSIKIINVTPERTYYGSDEGSL